MYTHVTHFHAYIVIPEDVLELKEAEQLRQFKKAMGKMTIT